MRGAMTNDPALVENIRSIFLHHRPHVSIMTAANLLGWSLQEMKAAIDRGEIETNKTPLELWPIDVIEDALGEDAARVLPTALRTHLLRARVPRYQVDMLQYMAEQESTTISAV